MTAAVSENRKTFSIPPITAGTKEGTCDVRVRVDSSWRASRAPHSSRGSYIDGNGSSSES